MFHFTPRKYLLDKFERGFAPRYNLEFDPSSDGDFFNKHEVFTNTNVDTNVTERIVVPHSSIYVAMVSFCDIPLSSLESHMNVYSSYGIGLSKKWSNMNLLNQVTYADENSELFIQMSKTLFSNSMYESVTKPKVIEQLNEIQQHSIDDSAIRDYMAYYHRQSAFLNSAYIAFTKPLSRKVPYKGIHKDYSYYAEKEWRYVPRTETRNYDVIRGDFDENQIEVFNRKKLEKAIKFTTEDVKYIIVESKDDIDFIIKGLNDIKRRSRKYSDEDIQLLTTKIITREQIKEDF